MEWDPNISSWKHSTLFAMLCLYVDIVYLRLRLENGLLTVFNNK